VITLKYEGTNEAQAGEAKMVLETLCACYPGYCWSVRVDFDGIFIRELSFPSTWGMALRLREVDHDAAVLKRRVVMLAGEWLERANLRRGMKRDGEDLYRVEGVPELAQPLEFRLPNVKIAEELPVRTEIRPQAKRHG
jgi:hypothetical protein